MIRSFNRARRPRPLKSIRDSAVDEHFVCRVEIESNLASDCATALCLCLPLCLPLSPSLSLSLSFVGNSQSAVRGKERKKNASERATDERLYVALDRPIICRIDSAICPIGVVMLVRTSPVRTLNTSFARR